MSRRPQSPFTILVMGILAMVFLSYLFVSTIDSNPTVQKILALHSWIQAKYNFSHLRLSLEKRGNQWGTYVEYVPTKAVLAQPAYLRKVEIAQRVFQFREKKGYILWQMPQTFVKIQERSLPEKEESSQYITIQDVIQYRRGRELQKRIRQVMDSTFGKNWNSEYEFTPKGWKGRIELRIPWEKKRKNKEECLAKKRKKCLRLIRRIQGNYLKSFSEILIISRFWKDGQPVAGLEGRTLFSPKILFAEGKK
ncbi:MAG: hypothetical protein D6785_08915 [Planctomycetota bacterium]|nr:MAG: hypothetical protein D6785_08915 [Planctomycetota bacterium]